MSASPALAADVLVNLFGAAGAVLLAREAHRNDPRGAVTRRIVVALGLVAALFLVRVMAWAGDGTLAHALSTLLAASTPLASLLVAEGMLRRHAPRALKLALAAAPFVVTVVGRLPFVPEWAGNAMLMIVVTGGFAAIAGLLWTRDASSLTASENSAVRGVLVALLVLAPMIATDFRSLWPEVPVRLGALGALVLLYVGLGSGNLGATLIARAVNVALFVACATTLALGLGAVVPDLGAADFVRAVAVSLSAILLSALWVQNHNRLDDGEQTLQPLLAVRTREDFARLLAEHPLFGGARVLGDATLDNVRHPGFASLFEHQPTLRHSAAPWGRAATDPGVERALSLMTAYEATHLGLVSREPLRLVAFSLPATASDAGTESAVEVARLVGEIVYLEAERT